MTHILILAALTSPALAQVSKPGGKTVECYCTDSNGARQELGDLICLRVDGKMFMAQCQMSLNVPMWRKISDGCLSSSLPQQSQPTLDPGPVDG